MGGLDIFNISERVSGFMMFVFLLRTVLLFGGILVCRYGIVMLWELRPVRKKRYSTVVEATVAEVTEENRSASMNRYLMPRFEYEQDGEVKYFMPREAYRPCRLKQGGKVKLCLGEKGKFRTIRSEVTLAKALIFTTAGLAIALLTIIL